MEYYKKIFKKEVLRENFRICLVSNVVTSIHLKRIEKNTLFRLSKGIIDTGEEACKMEFNLLEIYV